MILASLFLPSQLLQYSCNPPVATWGQFEKGVILMSQKDKKPYIMQIDSVLWNTHALKTAPIKGGAPSARNQGPGASALEPMLLKLHAGVKLWQ